MHPRIAKLYHLIQNTPRDTVLCIENLQILKDYGATRTEASVTIHLGFGLDIDVVDNFIFKSQLWPSQDVGDVLYETLKYMYYDPNDPNYEADDDAVQISI